MGAAAGGVVSTICFHPDASIGAPRVFIDALRRTAIKDRGHPVEIVRG